MKVVPTSALRVVKKIFLDMFRPDEENLKREAEPRPPSV
jgi:hypothetical protein